MGVRYYRLHLTKISIVARRCDSREGVAKSAARSSLGGYVNLNRLLWISISELLVSGIVVGPDEGDEVGEGKTLQPSIRSPFVPRTTRNA